MFYRLVPAGIVTLMALMTYVASMAVMCGNQSAVIVSFKNVRKIQLSRVGRGQRVVCDGWGRLCFRLVEPETGCDKTGEQKQQVNSFSHTSSRIGCICSSGSETDVLKNPAQPSCRAHSEHWGTYLFFQLEIDCRANGWTHGSQRQRGIL